MKYLPEYEMLPHIHMARRYDTVLAGVARKTPPRMLDNYELGYYLTDGGNLCINGEISRIRAGDMRFMRPGDVISSVPAYQCFTIFFQLGDPGELCRNELLDGIPKFFHGGGSQETLIEQIVTLFSRQEPGAVMLQNGLLLQLLYQCYRLAFPGERYCQAVRQCIAYMEEHLEKTITMETLGNLTGYSPLHIRRLFCRDTLITPHEYLGRLRIGRAKCLLADTDIPVSQVAVECGYSSESHFQMLFKKIQGCTPGDYRRKAKVL